MKTKVPKNTKDIPTTVQDGAANSEILAEHIVRISNTAEKLNKSGLNRRALGLLIRDAVGSKKGSMRQPELPPISVREINRVLDALPILKNLYCK